MDIKRLKELAGINERQIKSINLENHSIEELTEMQKTLQNKVDSTFRLDETLAFTKSKLTKINKILEYKIQLKEELKQVDGRWALVSKKTGKPLRYYKGEGKPSDEWVKKQEKSIQYFKNMNESSYIYSLSVEKLEHAIDALKEKMRTMPRDGSLYKDSDAELKRLQTALKTRIKNKENDVVKDGYESDIENMIAEMDDIEFDALLEELKKDKYHLSFECPDCKNKWSIDSRVEKDDECPRCGIVSAPKKVKTLKEDATRANSLIASSKQRLHNDPVMKNTNMAGNGTIENADEFFDKNSVDTITDENSERFGIAQDENTAVDIPAKIFTQIDNRIKELEDSMDQFDRTTFQTQWNYKQNAIDALQFIKDKLSERNLLGFRQAVMHYHEYASFISELLPASLINFLHTGMEQKNEIPTTSLENEHDNKLKLSTVPYNNVKPRDSSIYPQIPKSKF